ncbi:MAG TPA: DUF927 domain-containing protein [Burkholderiaceae bacterium]|nr:DUF927 domain-containing protein [Burkholderiaceae bacterium]
MLHTPPTPELIRAALGHIPPTLPRDEWAKVAMSIKSEYPDSTGLDLFDAWSQQDADNYDATACRDTWKSVKAGGGVGIGSLFHAAKANGWTPPKATHPASPQEAAAARQQAQQQAQQRAQRQQQEAEQTAAAHASAADNATRLWGRASDSGQSPYLDRKGVQGHGVRYLADGMVVVPMKDGDGRMWNVQRIAPDGGKRYLKGGRKNGLWHVLGTLPGTHGAATPETPAAGSETGLPAVVLLVEGLATGATLHQATKHPVAVAFDAGNLLAVAKAIRALCPHALVVVCGDDDSATEARTGSNPGREKATAAARAVGAQGLGLALFPEGLPPGGSDFNDLHTHHGGADGLATVQAQVQAGIQAHRDQQARQAQQAQPAVTSASSHAKADASPEAEWDRFAVTDGGVFYKGVDRDGKPTAPEWVCTRLDVVALTRDVEGNGWGYLLTFTDPAGKPKQWALPARLLAGDGGEYRSMLLNMGLRLSSSARARNLLTQYIQTRQPDEKATATDRVGWHGRAFVLPHTTLGDDAERVVFQTDSGMENTFRVRGTADAWRDRVAALCVGNSRLAFAVSCAFAGPLMRPAGMESGGFHLRGDSSSGKTTALRVAASVYGAPNYMQRWRTTDNALESIAAQHCDGLLILDELAQVDPKTAGECSYMLANESSKGRALRGGGTRPRLTWRLLFISAGEIGLADHMAEGMKTVRTGQEVRMADIPADAGAGLGSFETLHGCEGGAAFSRHMAAQSEVVYGAAGLAWLEWLTQHTEGLRQRIKASADALALQIVPESASGQVHRVGNRFALVAAAGELATEAGLTGWPVGEATRAARACFNAWLAARGGIGNGEVTSMLRQVRRFLEANGEGRFTWWHRAADDHAGKTLARAGFRRMVTAEGTPIKTDSKHLQEFGDRMPAHLGEDVLTEYFITPEVFRTEVCKGFSHEAVCKVLAEHDCLVMNEPGRHAKKAKLPGLGAARCYHVPPRIFELEL